MREEWTVGHAQGVHPGPFTKAAARQWIADDLKRDATRQSGAQGRQRLLRRYVTEWEEIPLRSEPS